MPNQFTAEKPVTENTYKIRPARANIAIGEDENQKTYPMQSMTEEAADEWFRLRVLCSYRQVLNISKQCSVMSSAAIPYDSTDPDSIPITDQEIDENDSKLSEIAHEWITINNVLVAIALNHVSRMPDDAVIWIVQQLSDIEKAQIVSIQDKLNNLDYHKDLIEAHNSIKELNFKGMQENANSIIATSPQEYKPPVDLDLPNKVSKKLLKKLSKAIQKSKKQ